MPFARNPGSLGENLAKQERIPCPRNRKTATRLNCFRVISIPGAPGHEPEVQCISKGKAHKRYEFGQKVAVAGTNRGNWTVAAPAFGGLPDNPYDGSRRAGTGRDLDRRAGRDRCGRDRCVR